MIRQLLQIITGKYRRQVSLIIACSVLMAFIEMLGVVSIAPFMAVVASPEIIQENEYLYKAYTYFNINSDKEFLVGLGFIVIFILVFNNIYSAFMSWLIIQFSSKFGHYLSTELLSRYLNQPYEFFLNRNSADLGKNILSETHRCVNGVITPIIEIFSKLVVSIFVIVMLIIIDPYIAATALFVIGLTYLIIYLAVQSGLSKIGLKSTESILIRYKLVNEAISSIKELKLHGKEHVFIKNFDEISQLDAKYTIVSNLIALLPRYLLESLIFSGVVLATILLIDSNRSGLEVIPLISVYTFAGYRLMPMLQHIYRGASVVKFNIPAFNILVKDIESSAKQAEETSTGAKEISLNSYVELKSVSFNYINGVDSTLKDINMLINHPSKIGLVGKTGSGKTTLVDIILGLFNPKSGDIIVDGQKVTLQNKSSWQKNLGYVPQDIFLLDDTIERNIAFAVAKKDINFDMVRNAARLAGIKDFINTLPGGFETSVGEKGVKLSGGQLQRIGIARALYFNPKLLVFDESTSALDGETESAIMDAINTLSNKKTIIIIAHRISTLKNCDAIYILKNGSINTVGTYEELISSNSDFRKMGNITV